MQLKVQVWIHVKKQNGRRCVLLFKTTPERHSFWQPVTGSVEKGESLREAALREAQEESGLSFQGLPDNLGFCFRFWAKARRAEEHVFALKVRQPKKKFPKIKLDPHEHVQYRWVSPSQARRLIAYSSNRKALLHLEKHWRESEKSLPSRNRPRKRTGYPDSF